MHQENEESGKVSRRGFIGGAMALGAGLGLPIFASSATTAFAASASASGSSASASPSSSASASAPVSSSASSSETGSYEYGSEGVLAGSTLDLELLREWLDDHRNYGAGVVMDFLTGEENAATDEEVTKILQIANSYMWCHFLGGVHIVAVRDKDEQEAIVPQNTDASGTVTFLMLADGCKDQDYHQAAYNSRTDAVQYWQMYYALDELGQAHMLLDLAARTFGYRIHNFGALSIDNISYDEGMGQQDASPIWACGGNFDMIRADNWDIKKYCSSQDGTVQFSHYVQATDEDIPLDGNLTLVFAVVMGKVDEDAVNTSVTDYRAMRGYLDHVQDLSKTRDNYALWDTGVSGLDIHTTPATYEDEAAYIEENDLGWNNVDLKLSADDVSWAHDTQDDSGLQLTRSE